MEAAPGAIVGKEAVGGIDMRGDFGVDRAVSLKQGVCSSEICCKSVLTSTWDTPQVYIAIANNVGFLVNLKTEIGWEGEDEGTMSAFAMSAFQAQIFAYSLLTHCWLRRFIVAEVARSNPSIIFDCFKDSGPMARAACFLISRKYRDQHHHKFRYERDGIDSGAALMRVYLSDSCLWNIPSLRRAEASMLLRTTFKPHPRPHISSRETIKSNITTTQQTHQDRPSATPFRARKNGEAIDPAAVEPDTLPTDPTRMGQANPKA